VVVMVYDGVYSISEEAQVGSGLGSGEKLVGWVSKYFSVDSIRFPRVP
jgi:hypothetical protein